MKKMLWTCVVSLSMFTACEKNDRGSTTLKNFNSLNSEVAVDYKDLSLINPESLKTALVCEGIAEQIEGTITFDESFSKLNLSFAPGKQAIVGKKCQIAITGEPKVEGDISSITDQEVAGLLYLSKTAPIMPAEPNEEGRKVSEFTAIFIKAFKVLKKEEEKPAAEVTVDGEVVEDSSDASTEENSEDQQTEESSSSD